MNSKQHILQVRSNTNFSINYDDFSLSPQVELVLLFQEPEYEAKISKDKKHFTIEKGDRLGEARFICTLEKLNMMIGELQIVATNLQKFKQLAHGLNTIIEHNRKSGQQPEPEQ